MLFPRLNKHQVLPRVRQNKVFIRKEEGDDKVLGDRRKEMVENYIRSIKAAQEKELGRELSEEEVRNSLPVQRFRRNLGI